MRIRRQMEAERDMINVIPLIDVMFILIIFFLAASNL